MGGEELGQGGVDFGGAADDVAALEEVVGALEVADAAAGFADDERAGRNVPLFQPELPEAVDAAGGEVAEVERCRSRPPQAPWRRWSCCS